MTFIHFLCLFASAFLCVDVCVLAEKELVLEIERLKRKNGPSTKKGKIPSKLDAFIRGIEEERDYYKQQTDMLQRMLRGEPASTLSKPSSRSASPVREKSSAVDKKVRSPYLSKK